METSRRRREAPTEAAAETKDASKMSAQSAGCDLISGSLDMVRRTFTDHENAFIIMILQNTIRKEIGVH